MIENLAYRLLRVPEGALGLEHLELLPNALPPVGQGEILVRVRLLSTDPANRVYLKRTTYRPRVREGDVMGGFAVGEVMESRAEGFAVGDLIFADTGWRSHAVVSASAALKLPPTEPLSHLLSVYGVTAGYTAFVGLMHFGHLRPGQTVVVSGAAGAVGSFAGQIARIFGCRVVGVAGSATKQAYLTEQLGFDAAISYHDPDMASALAKAAPNGVDVYFDNVGGDISAIVAAQMNPCGRILICGAIAGYDGAGQAEAPRPPRNVSMVRFLVLDFLDDYLAGYEQLREWVETGRIRVTEDIIEGLENAPAALIGLLAGQNLGKRMVRVC